MVHKTPMKNRGRGRVTRPGGSPGPSSGSRPRRRAHQRAPGGRACHGAQPGTTWMQEIVPLIMSGGDPASVETLLQWRRVPWLELDETSILNLEQRPSPRILCTHFQYNMMPPSFFEVKPKVIYVMRNPKDVFTSSFHYCGMASYLVNPGPQGEFLHKFLDGKVMFGSWFDHVKGWLNAEDKERIMHISYEEMKMELLETGKIF
ncbi:sulfotransferase 2B1-like [Sebastes umbrosus]|uniref:sulfotransferase 2B1-like n=1 Tax=Sebastes umbrosus TaxID=72105 RepID=UPI00189FB75C|nr:sulfotransferase 2B1-like [Sebastes umbrosus]